MRVSYYVSENINSYLTLWCFNLISSTININSENCLFTQYINKNNTNKNNNDNVNNKKWKDRNNWSSIIEDITQINIYK